MSDPVPSQVNGWDQNAIQTLATNAAGIASGLRTIADGVRRIIHDLEWSGDASRRALERADHECESLKAVANAYGRLADSAQILYTTAHYAIEQLKIIPAQLGTDRYTVDADWMVHAPSGGDAERAANSTVTLKSHAAHLSAMFAAHCPGIVSAVADIQKLAPVSASDKLNVSDTEIREIEKTKPGHGPRTLHDELLEKYNVSADPDGMVEYPPSGPLRWVLEQAGQKPKRVTAGEAALLDKLGTGHFISAYMCEEIAADDAKEVFGGKGLGDGHSDAFRHAYWSALLAQKVGPEFSERFTTAHERTTEDSHATSEAMDLYNNEVGRRIAAEHPHASRSDLMGYVEQAVRDGKMVVVDKSGHLVPSNTVAPGETGVARDPADPNGRDPGKPGGGY
ncbi:MAG: hypothetical protein HOQ24_06655 [Mycobacteriaceae bacterium]|nr:hypothetical protein [Mycobacteriaceae bacterium]